jgi:hypothetical protein
MRSLPAVICACAIVGSSVSARADDDDTVAVKIKGSPDAVLERMIEGTSLWESLCVGTCDAVVPRDGQYRVSGHGIRPSLPLALVAGRDGAVHLEPRVAYSDGYAGGVALAVIGPLVMIGGTISIAANNRNNNGCFGSCGSQSTVPVSQAPDIGGGIAIAIGGVMTIAAAVVLALSHHTTVGQGNIALSATSVRVRF